MNTYATIIAGTEAARVMSGTAARADGNPRHIPDQISSGIRGAGQYCSSPVLTSRDPNMTALRMTCGMMAVRGMCP